MSNPMDVPGHALREITQDLEHLGEWTGYCQCGQSWPVVSGDRAHAEAAIFPAWIEHKNRRALAAAEAEAKRVTEPAPMQKTGVGR